jgi:hydrogenase maturation protease
VWTVREARAEGDPADSHVRRADPPVPLLVGIGNIYRQDDGAGLLVARELVDADPDGIKVIENVNDPLSLVNTWVARETIVVDATCSGRPPGTVTCYNALAAPLPVDTFVACSTHHLGLHETIELARVLDRMPSALCVYGIEGSSFAHGTELSEDVRTGIDRVVEEIRGFWLTTTRSTPETLDA